MEDEIKKLIEEIRRLDAAATPVPWVIRSYQLYNDERGHLVPYEKLDIELIAYLRNNAMKLVKAYEVLLTDTQPSGFVLSTVIGEKNRISAQRDALDKQNERLAKSLEVARKALKQVDMCLSVPAAEYVPAISDAFKLIDASNAELDKLEKETK